MRCDSFETRLNEVLDQRGSPSEDRELRAHAESCAACRDLLVGQQLLFTGLDLAEKPAISSGFTSRVLARLADQSSVDSGATAGIVAPAGPALGFHRAAWWTGGIVAAAAIALIAGWEPISTLFAPSGQENPPANPLVNTHSPNNLEAPAPSPPQTELKQPTPPVVAQQPASEAPKVAVIPDDQLGRLLEAVQTLPTEEGSEFALQVVDGLRPIAEPMGSVLNVVRRGLLGGESQMQEPPPGKPQARSLFRGASNLS